MFERNAAAIKIASESIFISIEYGKLMFPFFGIARQTMKLAFKFAPDRLPHFSKGNEIIAVGLHILISKCVRVPTKNTFD